MAGFLVGDRPSYTPTVDTFNGTGAQTAFTLTQETTTDAAIVFISGVGQLPTGAYSISGTTLTFTSAPPSGTSNIWVTYNQPTGTTAIPSDGSISTAKLADLSVSTAKLQAGAVTAAKIETAPAIAVDNMTGTLPALDGSALTNVPNAMVLLDSEDTSGYVSSVTLTGLDRSLYNAYFFQARAQPQTTNNHLYLRFGQSGGISSSGIYDWDAAQASNGGVNGRQGDAQSQFILTGNSDGIGSAQGETIFTGWIHDALGMGESHVTWQGYWPRGDTIQSSISGAGSAQGYTNLTQVQFLFSASNIVGEFYIWGLKR